MGVPVAVNEGVAHFQNLQTCASVHACPVCAPKIRATRAREIDAGVERHVAAGGRVYFLTLTMPHDQGDELARLLDTTAAAFSACLAGAAWSGRRVPRHGCEKERAIKDGKPFGRAVWSCGSPTGARGCPLMHVEVVEQGLRAELGITGTVRSLEVTHGAAGWHPHLHVVVFVDAWLSELDEARLEEHFFDNWSRVVTDAGYRPPSRMHGIDLQPVQITDGSAAAANIRARLSDYVAGEDDVAGELLRAELIAMAERFEAMPAAPRVGSGKVGRRLGLELARHDLKSSRREGATPFGILADWMVRDALLRSDDEWAPEGTHERVAELARLWSEYETATKGHQAVTWSAGLKDRFGIVELSEKELAEQSVDGQVVAVIDVERWKELVKIAGAPAAILRAAEQHGGAGVVELVLGWTGDREDFTTAIWRPD